MGTAQDVAKLGSIFDPGDQASIAGQGAAIISGVGANSPYFQSGNLGSEGAGIVRGANTALHRDVGADFSQMEDNQAQLTALGQHFADLYQKGGPQAVAAAASAQASTANSGGGLGGLKQLASVAGDNTGKVGQIAQAERDKYGSQATASNVAAAASKLQQTLIQSALNHANRSKNTSATAIMAQEAIDQQNLNNSLQTGANAATHNVRSGGIANAADQAALGIAAATGLLSAGAAGAATAYNAFKAPDDENTKMTGNASSLNKSRLSIADAPGNQPNVANIPTDSLTDFAVTTPYGAAVATPESAWYNYLDKDPTDSNNAAYATYQGASIG